MYGSKLSHVDTTLPRVPIITLHVSIMLLCSHISTVSLCVFTMSAHANTTLALVPIVSLFVGAVPPHNYLLSRSYVVG